MMPTGGIMSFSKVLLLRAFNSSRPICVPFIHVYELLKPLKAT